MIEFLIKSTVAMGVLLGLYYILFEREKMHRFNRFYLISALVFSLALPLITVVTYIQKVNIQHKPIILSAAIINNTPLEQPIDYPFYIGWGLYTLITLVLAIRFIKNIAHFFRKASANPSVKMGNAKLILLEEKVLPHTFLNYIFVNREEHKSRKIQDELYTHEYTHVKQYHTLDILFIEALKTIFWFNPLLYFYKKAIQLNHEFLADEKVIDTTTNTIYYQNLLLKKATVGTTFSMASNLTFSLTKKRLIMMTKTTSTAKAGLLKLAIAPVVTALMMLLCTKTVAQETLSDIPPEKIKSITVNKNVTPQQVDSLQKANPKVYKSKNPKDYGKTDVSYTDKNGKPAKKKFFVEDSAAKESNESTQLKKGLSGIPPEKIKTLNIYKNLAQSQIDSLRQADPKTYVSNNPRDYGMIKVEYTDENGNLVKKKFFTQQ
jgi:hypothetical protein